MSPLAKDAFERIVKSIDEECVKLTTTEMDEMLVELENHVDGRIDWARYFHRERK